MRNYKKVLKTAIVLCMVMTITVTSMAAEVIRVKKISYTSKPKASIMITAEGYTEHFNPAGGVHVYNYGVRAYTSGYGNKQDIQTNFTFTGTLTHDGKIELVSKSKTGESLEYEYGFGSEPGYVACAVKVKTSSATFGVTTQDVVYNVRR